MSFCESLVYPFKASFVMWRSDARVQPSAHLHAKYLLDGMIVSIGRDKDNSEMQSVWDQWLATNYLDRIILEVYENCRSYEFWSMFRIDEPLTLGLNVPQLHKDRSLLLVHRHNSRSYCMLWPFLPIQLSWLKPSCHPYIWSHSAKKQEKPQYKECRHLTWHLSNDANEFSHELTEGC